MTPQETIFSFLSANAVADPKKLRVAILFARSMVEELNCAASEWEAAAAELEKIRRVSREAGANN